MERHGFERIETGQLVDTYASSKFEDTRRKALKFGARVLEVGCGDGRLTVPVAERAASVLAFDPDEEAVAAAREALPASLAERVTFAVASATEIEIPRSEYDIVLFSWSL